MANDENYTVKEDIGEWGIPLEELGDSDIDNEDGDLVLEQHLTVYNKPALERLLNDFKLDNLEPLDVVTFTTEKPVEIKDVFDDLSREEAFYNQALAAARHVKQQAEALDAPFLPGTSEGGLTIKEYKKNKTNAAPRAVPRKKAAAEKEENEFIDRMTMLKRKRKEAKEEDDFTLDVDYDMDELEENDRKKKYQRNSPNVKLNRKNDGSGKKKLPQSALKKKGPKKRPGKARRAAIRNRR